VRGGVYVIFDPASYAAYIGQSSEIDKRWKAHRAELTSGRHTYQEEFGAAWGTGTLRFRVLETLELSGQDFTDRLTLEAAEARWMEHYEPLLVNRLIRRNGRVVRVSWPSPTAPHLQPLSPSHEEMGAAVAPILRRRSRVRHSPPTLPSGPSREDMRQELVRLQALVDAQAITIARLAGALAKALGVEPTDAMSMDGADAAAAAD
jgi:hypothetical protein